MRGKNHSLIQLLTAFVHIKLTLDMCGGVRKVIPNYCFKHQLHVY